MTLTTEYQRVAQTLLGNTGYGNVYVRTYVKYNSQSIENNTSNVSIQARIYTEGGYWWSDSGTTYRITGSESIDSKAISCNGRYNVGETTLGTITKDIVHNNDGSRTIHAESNFTSNPWGWNATASGTDLVLPTIPRASSVSSSSPYIGDNATVIISSASSSFRNTLSYWFGNAKGTIVEKTNQTTVAWDTSKSKDTLYAQIPNAKSGSGTIYCDTYSGDTLIGTKQCDFNLYAKEDECRPSISGSVIDTNSTTVNLTGNNAVMVKYMSKPKVTISATAKYSSSIKSYSINVDGQTINSSSATYDTIISNNILISTSDSRGYTNSTTLKPTLIEYVKLNSNLTITRPEQTSSEAYLNGSGQWFNGKFSSSNSNSLTITCKYRKTGDSSWTNYGNITPSISGNTFSISNLKLGSSFDYGNEYQFQITISDKLMTIGNQTKDIIVLSVGKPIIRVGKEDVIVNGHLNVTGDLIAPVVYKKYLGTGINLNDVTTPGQYGIYNINIGVTTVGISVLEVVKYTDDWILQRITTIGTYPKVYERCYHSGNTWGNWTKEPLYDVGGSLTTDGNVVAGWSVKANDGQLYATKHGNTVTIGSQNASWCHIYNSADIPFYFNRDIFVRGDKVWPSLTLYENSSGTNGTVTLSQSASEFSFLEIYYTLNTRSYATRSVRVPYPNDKTANLDFSNWYNTTYGMYIFSKNVYISGTSIVVSNTGWQYIGSDRHTENADNIYITKVVGYR